MKKIIQLTIMCLLFMSNLIYANNHSTNNNGVTCNVTASSSNGTITVLGMDANTNTKLFTEDFTTVWECNPWFGSPCTDNETITGLAAGTTYFLSVNSGDCSEWIPITVEGGGSCAINGTITNCTQTNTGIVNYDILVTNPAGGTFILNLFDIGSGPFSVELAYNETHTITESGFAVPFKTIVDSNDPNCSFNIPLSCQPFPSSITIENCPQDFIITAGQSVNWTSPTIMSIGCDGPAVINQSEGPDNGEILPVGIYTVVYNASNVCGNSATCSFTVTVIDNGCNIPPPVISNCERFANFNTTQYDIFVSSPSINSTTFTMSISTSQGMVTEIFTYETTHSISEILISGSAFTRTIIDGLDPNCTTDITIDDCDLITEVRFTSCPDDFSVNLIETQIVSWEEPMCFSTCATSASFCDINQVTGPANGSSQQPGEYLVEYNATDNCNNIAICSFTVTVLDDVDGCNVNVTSSNGNINITGLTGAENVKLFNSDFDVFFECNPWNGNPCTANETVSALNVGETFFLSVQSDVCNEWIPITVEGGGNQCSGFDATVTNVACNTGNITYDIFATATNPDDNFFFLNVRVGIQTTMLLELEYDQIHSIQEPLFGATERIIEPFDAFNDDVCTDQIYVSCPDNIECLIDATITDCTFNNLGAFNYNIFVENPNNPNGTFRIFNLVNNAPVELVLPYGIVHSLGETGFPGGFKFIEDTNDPNCNLQVPLSCEPFPSSITIENCPQDFSVTVGQSANWTSPTIMSIGCDGPAVINQSEGPDNGEILPVGIYTVVYNASNVCGNSATCSFTVTVIDDIEGCNVNVTSSNGNITITGLTGAENVKLFDADFNVLFECNPWNGNPCTGNETVSGLNVGETFFLSVQSDVCNEYIPITVEGGGECTVQVEGTDVGSGLGLIQITGGTENDNVTLLNNNGDIIFECNPYLPIPCLPSNDFTVEVANSPYFLSVQSDICDEFIEITFDNILFDTDGDGIPDNEDCQPTNPFLPTTPGSICNDFDVNTFNDVIQSDGCTCMGTPGSGSCPNGSTNLALGASTSQSSTLTHANIFASSDLAVDGNTNGDFNNGSVSATNQEFQAWWEVDLGAVHTIELIEIYNKTNGTDKLRDYYYMVSDTPFDQNGSTEANLAIADFSVGKFGVPSTYTFTQFEQVISGRYVRIQLEGTGFCTIAEVMVTGCPISAPIEEGNTFNLEVNSKTINSFDIKSVFPNPASQSTFIQIESNVDETYSLEVYDLVGKLQQQTTVNIEEGLNTIELDIHNLNAGIHNVFLRNSKGIAKSFRIVKTDNY